LKEYFLTFTVPLTASSVLIKIYQFGRSVLRPFNAISNILTKLGLNEKLRIGNFSTTKENFSHRHQIFIVFATFQDTESALNQISHTHKIFTPHIISVFLFQPYSSTCGWWCSAIISS